MSNELMLPNGQTFASWSDQTDYQRTLHVAQAHHTTVDSNDGSPDRPFRTIGRAAVIAEPGDRILIHAGIYREVIRPLQGGTGQQAMICYEGAAGEQVIITGAEIYTGTYRPSEGWKKSQFMDRSNRFQDEQTTVYMLKLPRQAFDGVNPFAMVNGGLMPWFFRDFAKLFHSKSLEEQKEVVKKRGMIFVDNQRLRQVANYYELGGIPGSYFVEDDGLLVHIRLFDDSNPAEHIVEFTAREQCFCPEERYQAYIRLENLIFEKAGTGFPPPQRGAVSTNCGHHWLIDHCTVRQINGIGMDIGFQAPARLSDAPRGFMQVINCTFDDCGFSGLVGTCGQTEQTDYIDMLQPSLLIINNRFLNCCWQFNEESMEEAALKLHHTLDSIVCGNSFNGTGSGCAFWADATHTNLAIRENVMINIRTRSGAMFIESSRKSLSFDHNLIIGCRRNGENGGNGVYSHHSENIINHRNIILDCEQYGFNYRRCDTSRITDGRGNTDFNINLFENLVADCGLAVFQPLERNQVDRNIYGHFHEDGYLKVGVPELHLNFEAWQDYMHFDVHGMQAKIEYQADTANQTVRIGVSSEKIDVQTILHLDQPIGMQIDALIDQLIGAGDGQ